MRIPVSWLREYVKFDLPVDEVARRLTMAGLEVESIERAGGDWSGVVVGHVKAVNPHPNADRLRLVTVDTGSQAVEVVCGAPNVQAGKRYPFAAVGTVLPGGLTLERRKIRGVVSNGMLCSARELGLGDEHEGILELETTAEPGTPLLDVLPLADDQLHIEVTANRPDLLGHKGVARDLAAVLGATVRLPPFPGPGPHEGPAPAGGDAALGGRREALVRSPGPRAGTQAVVDGVEVRLEDPEGAPRYMIAVIRGVTVGPSPAWLRDRLAAVDQRSINNVVDATNYILLELNQPMHAFDLAKLRGPAVVVRRAKAGEPITTLDGVPRTLTAEMTAICDAQRPTIVAGVMGSAESEVSETTTDLVLECAYFQPARIRRTRKALGLQSDSSYRYERGIDLQAMPDALRRAVELIVRVAGGAMREPALDLWPEPARPPTVFLRPERVTRLLGVTVARAEIEQLLARVGFVAAPKDDRLAVQVPGWRPDVTRDVDLIEEIARLKGYDTFPDELGPYRLGTVPDAPLEQARARVRARCAGAGLLEARTMPLGPADGPDAVEVLNPMSAEERFLRARLLPGLVRRVEHNWAARNRDVRLFEVGTVFRRGNGEGGRGNGGLPEEWTSVAAVITGARRPPHWADGETVPDMDIWDLKHHFELAVAAALPGTLVRPAADGAGWEAVTAGGDVVGSAGPLEADRPAWAGALFGFLVPALWIITLGSAITVAQRFSKAYQEMEQIDASERAALRERG